MCAGLPLCVKSSTITQSLTVPPKADNEALSTSLSSQLTAAGTNGIVSTPPPRPSARACSSFDNHTKADQSADQSADTAAPRPGPPTRPRLGRPGRGVTAVTVRLEPKQHAKMDTVTSASTSN